MFDLTILFDYMFDIVAVWCVFEIIFFAIVSIAVHFSLQKLTKPPMYEMHPVELVRKVLDTIEKLNCYNHDNFFEGFFCGARKSEIYQDNLRSFLSWVMYSESLNKLSDYQMNELEEMVSEICGRLELNLSPGYNYDIKHVKMTLEPIPFIHRPLIVYLFTGVSNKMTDFFLLFSGFKRCESGPVRYWYRPAVSEIRTSKNPIVFFHGITSGWGVYWSMIKILSGQRETFLFDLDSVRVHSLQFKFLPSEIYCQHVMQALESHNVKKVSIVGHSFGSITSAWFVKQYPQYVDHLTLIDPVSLLLALPDVAYNFLYRKPSTFVEWVLHVMASREITVANALRRNFWWYKNVLWLEDIPSSIGVVVSVAGGDEITKAEAVKEYVELVANHRRERLTEIQKSRLLCSEDLKEIAPVSCLYYDGQSHAEILFRIEQLHEVSRVLGQHESRFKHL